ncbi:hypothetical protein OD808_02150 [Aeromonas veronii]|uniref:hypothetical protein n=1 Tax=Aeromonas veronii TaxID=654 RepID=UPI002247BB91|nr:hypothetical protein [Aeromonas veronii]EKP0300225.1 hypothetical protein [Aeromonas veronii]MCX0429674.1 hypothetical protein [Aeromonas veronii]
MGKRGPKKGVPKVIEAKIIRYRMEGLSQLEAIKKVNQERGSDDDSRRTVRRIEHKLNSAVETGRAGARCYEKHINKGILEMLHRYQVGEEVIVEEYLHATRFGLVTKQELFDSLEQVFAKAIEAITENNEPTRD